MPTRFERIRKTEIARAARGPWLSLPKVRLGRRGQIYFSHHAAQVFAGRRMVTVDFEPQALVLRFTGIETLPPGMSPDDFFRLTSQGKQTNGMSLAAKSLLAHLGFRATHSHRLMPYPRLSDPRLTNVALAPGHL